MKTIIAGGRDYSFNTTDVTFLNNLKPLITEVVCGEAKGGDTEGKGWGIVNNIPIKSFPANWDKHGKSAGYKRNYEMAEYADSVVLFPGGKGTNHMHDIAKTKGLKVFDRRAILNYDKSTTHNNVTLYYNDEKHKYWTDKCDDFTSVTTFIDEYFPRFEEDRISKAYAKKHNMTQEEVLKLWDIERVKGCDLGNNVHDYCECYLKGTTLPKAINKKAATMMKNITPVLKSLLKDYDIVGCEKILFSEKYKIAGTIDLLVRHKKTKQLRIIDWKTNKKINKCNTFKKYGFPPITHLSDINYEHYALQTSLYKYLILHENYHTDDDMTTAICHIKPVDIVVHKTPYYENEIRNMLELRLDNIN